jgi:hypothetical protein
MQPRRSIFAVVALAAALGVGAAACGGSSGSSSKSPNPTAEVSPAGDIPDTQAFVSFTPATGGYSIKVPEGWARTDLLAGATFTDKLNTIRVESMSATAAPTDASVRANDVPTLQSSVPGFKLDQISSVPRTAGTALLMTYHGTSAADSVTGKTVMQDIERYQFWKNGTVVTITLTSPKGADNVDPWKTVTNSFGWQ